MERRKRLTAIGIMILVLVVVWTLGVRFALAQGTEPEIHIYESSEPEDIEAVGSAIPIQGRLTDDNGNPLDGVYVIYAALYPVSTGGTALCSDTDSVLVENGLFNMDLDGCLSADVDGKQLYLGIKVGGDPEMTPRRVIYPVPYAWSLRPGAIISGTTSTAIVHIENWRPSGRGLRSYAMSETGLNYGIVGASRSTDGYGGYFYNNSTEGTTYGVAGWSDSDDGYGGYFYNTANGLGSVGLRGEGTIGVYGEGTKGGIQGKAIYIGVLGRSEQDVGVEGRTDAADQNYGLYTDDNLYSLNYHTAGAQMQVVQNGGQTLLETGDVVVFSGIGEPLEAGAPPVIQVAGVDTENSTAVAGVVYSRYNFKTQDADPEEAVHDYTPEGPAAPGEYLLVVVRGPAQVKASAQGGPLRPGDLLSSSGQAGLAAKATKVTLDGVETPLPGTILGKVLESLDEGEALIYIFVTLQ